MAKNLNLIGKKINKLTVLRQAPYSGGRTRFICKCECGKEKEFDGPKLNSGAIKSCGCFIYTEEGKKSLSKRHRLDWGESAKNRIIGMYKSNAKIKGIEFDLSKEQMEILFKGKCFYCGREPYKNMDKPKFYGNYTYNGIDRLINTKGYTSDNTVSCCSQCNYLKNSYDYEDFTKIIKLIYENLKISETHN
jgi:hypothetical protein